MGRRKGEIKGKGKKRREDRTGNSGEVRRGKTGRGEEGRRKGRINGRQW